MKNIWKNFYVILFAVFISMTVLGMNTPTYPDMSQKLNIATAFIPWMSASYSIGAAILAPMMGKFGDNVGIKKMSVLGLFIFTVSCLIIAVAPTYGIILLGRFLQGLAIACLLPQIMAFIGIYMKAEDNSKAFAYFGAACSAGVIFGPVISGFLCKLYGFRAVFFVAAIASLFSSLLVMKMMEKTPAVIKEKLPFDYLGSLFLTLGVGSLLILPTIGVMLGYGHIISLILLAVGITFLFLFVKRENSFKNPVVKISLLKQREFIVPAILYLGYNGISQLFLYAMSYYFAMGLSKGVESTGMWTMVVFIVMTLSASAVGYLMKKFDWKLVAMIAIITTIMTVLLFTVVGKTTPMIVYYLGAILLGFSGAFNTPLNTAAAIRNVANEIKGSASGSFRLIGDLGGPIFVTLFLPLLEVYGRNNGSVDYVSAFPRLMWTLLIPVGLMFVLTLIYPTSKNTNLK